MSAQDDGHNRFLTWLLPPLLLLTGFVLLLPDLYAQDDPRVSEVCLDCHEGYDAALQATPHQLAPEALDGPDAVISCTDCHHGDARHYEDDPEAYPMSNPARMGAADAALLCSGCHMSSHQQSALEMGVHADNDVNCSGCHQLHGSSQTTLLKAEEPELCYGCHAGVEGDFAKPFRHPVNDEIVSCSGCHQTLNATTEELSLAGTNVCMDCHGEFEGPFPYEHQATVDYSTEEGACLTCHEAHGSSLPRMLKQPYESPHNQLCSQCHSVPLHNMNQQHGTKWAGMACNDCHTDIHGSYTSSKFLSESLEGQGCFNAGCHQF